MNHAVPLFIGGLLARSPFVSFDFKKKIFIWHKANEKQKTLKEAINGANHWDFHFESKNIMQISKMMPDHEQEVFYYDIAKVDWEEYLRATVYGTAIHLGKEDHIDP